MEIISILSDTYLRPNQISMMKLFCENIPKYVSMRPHSTPLKLYGYIFGFVTLTRKKNF